MSVLLVKTFEHRHDPGSEYLDHWTAEVIDSANGGRASMGGRYGAGQGRLESQAVKAAVNSYFKVRTVEGR